MVNARNNVLIFSPSDVIGRACRTPVMIAKVGCSRSGLSRMLDSTSCLRVPAQQEGFAVSFTTLSCAGSLSVRCTCGLSSGR